MLGVPVQYFYDDAPNGDGSAAAAGLAEPSQESYVVDFLASREGLELNKAFVRITDARQRRAVLDLVRSLAGEEPPSHA